MPSAKVLTALSLATLFATAYGQGTNQAGPGTLNYVEGHVALEGRAVTPHQIGNLALNAGQSLSTADGHAEVLLTPGVFLRLDHDTTVTMVKPNLTQTEVAVVSGRAELEVDALYKQNDLLVDDKAAQTKILEHGLYEFDANANQLKVFDGKAAVSPSQEATKWIDVKGSHEFALNGDLSKPQHFDKDASKDELYKWSSLRADYLGQTNENLLAGGYEGAPGWAWDAGFGYTWLPYDGLFYSPFGYGFYSPGFFYGGGFGYGGYGRGFYGRGGYAHAGYGGFHGGGYAGRGFSGGGGFHGGGGGGGFHGGGGGHR